MSKRATLDTELRNALSGREPELCAAILARVCDAPRDERRDVEIWFSRAADVLADADALARRCERLADLERVTLALLTAHPWWSRVALAQAVGLLRPTVDATGDSGPVGEAVAKVLRAFPVLLRTNSWTRTEELSLFEPLAIRLRPLVEDALAVGHGKLAEPLPDAGLWRTLLALALFPGLVAQRRPRVTRGGDLHAADATRLERTLGEARGMYATWDRLQAFEEIDGALAPVASRCRALLDDPGGLVAELLRHRLSDLGWELASLAAAAPEGHGLELGASLLAVGLRARFAYGLDPSALVQHVVHEDLRFAPLLFVSMREDTLAVPRDVRAAVRGEAIAVAAGGRSGFVQPNYEVVIPPGAPLAATFVVGCAAELRHLEAVARLELTRESVLAARAVGIEPAAILTALEAISAPRPLPAAVRHAVEEWGASVGEARVRTAVLFDVRASDSLLEVVARELDALVLDRPAPRLFVLARAPNPRELARLRDLGVVTRTVAQATQRPERDDDEPEKPPPPFALRAGRMPLRDLRDDVDPYRTAAVADGSRPRKTGAQKADRGALDPDDGAERPLSPLVRAALDERRQALGARPEQLAELRRLEASPPFRRAAATSPSALALAIRRAADPARLSVEVARLVAEASMRRASD